MSDHDNYLIKHLNRYFPMGEQKSNNQEPPLRQLISSFPLKCKMYLSLLINLHDAEGVSVPKNIKKAYQSFTSIFKKLPIEEQREMIESGIKYLSRRLKGETVEASISVEEIETSCEVKTSMFGVSYWDKKSFRFDFGHRCIKLFTPKKMEIVQVKHYLARKSKSQKNAIVMESIESAISDAKAKICIRFKNKSVFEEIYENIRKLLMTIANKRLEKLLKEEVTEMLQTEADEIISKGLTFLTTKAINEYFDEKLGELKKIIAYGCKTFEVFNQHGVSIRNSSDNGKYYFLNYALPSQIQSIQKARQIIPILSVRPQQSILHIERLQSFNQSLTAQYFKATAPTLQWQSVMIVESIDRGEKIERLMMATSNIFHGVNIHFMRIQLTRHSNFRFVVNIEIVLKSNSKRKQNMRELAKLLTCFVNKQSVGAHQNLKLSDQKELNDTPPLARKKSYSSSKNRKEYFESNHAPSVNPDSTEKGKSSQNDEVFYSIEDEQNQEEVQVALSQLSVKNIGNFNLYQQKPFAKQKFNPYAFLKRYYQLNAELSEGRIYNNQHFPKQDWQKLPKGGVVCINQKVITQQKNVFKLICKQFGSKLFKMEGGMNLSLPVQICRPESALISIARNLTYAPVLLENHSKLSALNRIQNVVILQISMGMLALSTQKPFNPILGETYQAWVDGCPLYMQQISHHPPITYIYFVGRGYKIYGPVAPQIGIRLNYCKGINQSYLTVQFDSGQKIDFNLPTMIINGMLFGQRSIYFDSTNYVIDFHNRLVAEVIFNAGKGFFGSKQSPDYLTVQIYEVTQPFFEQFLSNKRNISPKKAHGSKLCSSFAGQWNGSLIRGSETVFNFLTIFPILMVQQEIPLPSDSVYRADVAQLLNNDMEKAQMAKQKFQQIQRKDKKLRADYSKKKK